MRWLPVCALLFASRMASGAPSEAYRLAWLRGNELVDQHRWSEARAQFQAAWEIEHRPILLFNIAQTYLYEGDAANARGYYQRYIDVAEREDLAAIARERLAQLAAPGGPPPAAARATYPAAVIDRPPTLLAHTLALGAGVAIAPRFTAAAAGGVATSYDTLGVLAAGYAPHDGVELAGEVDLALADAGRGLAAVRGALALADGELAASLRAGLAFTLEPTHLYDLRLAAAVRWKLTDALAVVSNEDDVLITLDDAHAEVFLRAPIGIAYQLAPRIYGELSTRLAVAELRAPSLQLLGADFALVALAVTIVPRGDLDIVVQARAFDAGSDGSVVVRWRR